MNPTSLGGPRSPRAGPSLPLPLLSEEKENQWIAIEVHDRIAQTLAAAFQSLQTLEPLTRATPQAHQITLRALSLLRQAIKECRDIMKELYPQGLHEFGLRALIEEELDQFQKDTGCKTSLQADHRIPRSGDVEVALYRIFHEALINIGRHARDAKKVTVSLGLQEPYAVLSIKDDGCGFNVQAQEQVRRVGGLMTMRRRAELLSGTCTVTSAPGQGTSVSVRIPLDREGLAR